MIRGLKVFLVVAALTPALAAPVWAAKQQPAAKQQSAAPAAAPAAPAPDGALETPARQVYLLDLSTETVLYEKAADERMTPSSMTKLMTLYLLFDRLAKGAVKMSDEFPVSERAWRMQGSKMFVMVGTSVKVEDLIRGIIIQSGNDACVVVAETLASSEEAFAQQMNAKAKELGMTGSHFMNASGWPDPDHYSTAHDLAVLADHIIHDFPQYYPLFSETSYKYANIDQGNRDPLLGRVAGADGLKTGHTEDGGYGLVGSAMRDGRRLILVANGMSSMKERAQEGARIMEWGFREFQSFAIAKTGQVLAEAPVWQGEADTVPLTVAADQNVTIRRVVRPEMQVKVVYDGPIPAPLQSGEHIADLEISAPGMPTKTVPLVAGRDVARAGLISRMFSSLRYLVGGNAG